MYEPLLWMVCLVSVGCSKWFDWKPTREVRFNLGVEFSAQQNLRCRLLFYRKKRWEDGSMSTCLTQSPFPSLFPRGLTPKSMVGRVVLTIHFPDLPYVQIYVRPNSLSPSWSLRPRPR